MPDGTLDPMPVFAAALGYADPAERAAYLSRVCGDDSELRARVEALLSTHTATGRFADPDATGALDAPQSSDATGSYAPDMPAPPGPATGDYRPDGTTGTYDESHNASHVPAPPSDVGTVIAGRYTLLRLIGEGGMGSVYLVSQTEPVKRQVALKLIKAGMDSKLMLARFDAERQALALMDHPNIARIYDGGMTPTGQPYFVMEWVQGVPITEYSDQHRLPVDERLRLFVSVCHAVQHAHQKGIIHRDLKPGNILVTEVDGRPTPKVIDFGVAKATEHQLTDLSLADDGAIVGTPAYMSPEQADPTSLDIDTRSDVYALGIILYELLTGGPPIDAKQFRRGAILEMLRMVREVDAPRPSTKLSSADALPNIAANRRIEPARLTKLLRNELDWIVLKALEKDRGRRYDTVNGFAADVLRYLADEPVEARPPSRGYRLRKFVRRNKVQVIAAATVFLALVGGVIGTASGLVQAQNARDAEVGERKRAQELADSNARLAADESRAKVEATALAKANDELAKQESAAKAAAQQLAVKNGQLAAAEQQARRDVDLQLQRTQATLFTSQMERVGAVLERDPTAALELLNDEDACPRPLRDIAWAFAEKAAKRREYTSFPVPAGPNHAISADGKLLAVAELTRVPGRPPTSKVTVIEVATGKPKAVLPAFSDSVELMAFTPDGQRLAVVADGFLRRVVFKGQGPPEASVVPGKVQVWDLDGPKLAVTCEGHKDRITSLSFSASGALLATASLDKTACIWDVATGKNKHTLEGHRREVSAVAFRPDGKRLATGGLDNAIKLWDADSGKLLDTWTPAANPAPELAVRRGQDVRTMPPMQGPTYIIGQLVDAVLGLDFSPDGTSLVSSNSNWLIEVRDADTGQIRATVRDLKQPLWWVRFHNSGKSVLGFYRRETSGVVRWDATTGAQLYELPVTAKGGGVAVFGKESGLLVVTGGGRCVIHDLDAPLERATLKVDKARANLAVPVFARNGETLAVGCGTNIYVWDTATGTLRHTLKGHKNAVQSLTLSPDGFTLASSAIGARLDDGSGISVDDVRLWNLKTGEIEGELPIKAAFVPSVAFNKGGDLLAVLQIGEQGLSAFQAVATVWDVKTRQRRHMLKQPNIGFAPYAIYQASLAFNPADDTLVTAAGQSLCIWDLTTEKPRKEIRVGGSDLNLQAAVEFAGVAVRPDGRSVVAVTRSGPFDNYALELTQWNAMTGEQEKKVANAGGHRMTFTSDSRSLIATTPRNTIEVRDALTLQKRLEFPPHGRLGQIGVAVHPDGQTLATACLPVDTNWHTVTAEGTLEVKLWDVSRSPAILTFPASAGQVVQFSPDSRYVVELNPKQGRARLWELATGRVVATTDTKDKSLDGTFSPDGRYLVGADVGGGTLDDRLLAKMRTPETNLLKHNALLTLWDRTTLPPAPPRHVEIGKGVVAAYEFSPDGRRIAFVLDVSVGDGKVIKVGVNVVIWNLDEGRAEAAIRYDNVTAFGRPAFSADGGTIAVPVGEGVPPAQQLKVLLLDVRKGAALPTLDLNVPSDNTGRSVRFTADGARLVIRRAGPTDPLTLWDWRKGEEVKEPIPDVFGAVNVSRDGRYELVTSSASVEVIDRTVKPPVVVSQRRSP